MRTEVQTGVSDGEWIEVTNRQRPGRRADGDDPWVPIDGTEQVILGDLSLLADGAPVRGRPGDGGGETRERDARCRSSSGESRPEPGPVEASNDPMVRTQGEL